MTQEQRLAAAEGLTEVLARTTGTAEHPTRLARATATATGELKSLDLHPNALAQGPDAVGRLVVETARLATDAAVQTSYNELAKSLGDSMAMAVEAFAGPPPLNTAPAVDTSAPRPPVTPPVAQRQPGEQGWSGAQQRAATPSAPPWAGQRPNRPAPRPEPAETDDDDYFADPFRGQRR
ncbi:YbaB/EbfC family nucleoid-associated protein [Saccharothrix deserti]|uniref:YbaB/EbfC family nucleoid-associated protein n=1 Tax=Saccharothrix deserti TaxID=2593674 RepID=UPI00131AA371|nr:YbaB/EbfC family nucleoid-associated protein [Saccharothrix deserti]